MILLKTNFLDHASYKQLCHDVDTYADHPAIVRYDNKYEKKHALDAKHFRPDSFIEKQYNYINNVGAQWLRRLWYGHEVHKDNESRGCGLHILPPGGFLDLHYDGNWHPDLQKARFANAVYYVKGPASSKFIIDDQAIRFEPNMLVVFTTENVLHGVPDPVDYARFTLSSFYYMDADPPERKHRALFVNAPEGFSSERAKL
jgi:hypothetical protein